jgi:hypothetical protein
MLVGGVAAQGQWQIQIGATPAAADVYVYSDGLSDAQIERALLVLPSIEATLGAYRRFGGGAFAIIPVARSRRVVK